MKTTHVFEDGYYLIGNKSVAKSFMFKDKFDCCRFRNKMVTSLSPICEILAFGLRIDEFQLIIRMKNRSIIENYYLSKQKIRGKDVIIPETTYIFGQIMANLQSGYVKFFNHRYDRDGGLMARRYHRQLIESESELYSLIEMVHSEEIQWKRKAIWTFRRKGEGFIFADTKGMVFSSKEAFEKGSEEGDFDFLNNANVDSVRGHFKNLPLKKIIFKNRQQKIENLVAFMLMNSKS